MYLKICDISCELMVAYIRLLAALKNCRHT